MTRERLVVYMDAMVDRIEAAHEARIEEVRVGYIFARDPKSHRQWLGKRRTPRKRGLVGDALEAAVMGIAQMFPENVERVTA